MQQTHLIAENKYQKFREESLAITQSSLSQSDSERVQLKLIEPVAQAQAKAWENDINRSSDATWSWSRGFNSFAMRNPKRFELAIWFANAQLCGLSIGVPTNSGNRLRLDIVESAPFKHPLRGRIMELSIAAAEDYATLIGATQVRLMKPVNAELIAVYKRFGFTYHQGIISNKHSNHKPSYLWKNL